MYFNLLIITIDQWPHDLIRERKVFHALARLKGIRRNMSTCDASPDKMNEIGLHQADRLIKRGVNIK